MGEHKMVSTKKAELHESGVTLQEGDKIKKNGEIRYKILRFTSDGYVVYKFIENIPDISKGEKRTDLLDVWDNRFRKRTYEKVNRSGA